jgi:hypothetical protein
LTGTSLGSEVLAETSCTSPTGPDAAPSSALTIAPNSGPDTGGTATTITGSGFTGATGVSFDGVAGTSFSVVDDTTITVTTPPGVVGPADVVVIDSGGDGALPAGFTYTAAGAGASAPTEISPASGPAAGSTPVTIRGAGFMRAAGVTFDGAAGTSFAVVDDTTITVTTPSGAVGPADVVVIDAAGNGALPRGFTYVSAGAMPRTGAAIMMMLAAGTSTMGAGLAIRHFARRRRPLHAAT